MGTVFEIEYKGYIIKYNEELGTWWAYLDGIQCRNSNGLKELKLWIDRESKKEFTRVKVWKLASYHAGFDKVEITSVTDEGETWGVVERTGRREKFSKHEKLFLDTEANMVAMERYKDYLGELKTINGHMQTLVEGMERYKIEVSPK